MRTVANASHREPLNKGKIVGQKAPFKLKNIWVLRVRFQMEHRVRELALINLGIDSKRQGCDLVARKVRDVRHGDLVASRAVVMQHKTQQPIQFEITPAAREAVQKWIKTAGLRFDDFLFPGRIHESPHLRTRQDARILEHWVKELGLDPAEYGTHSMRRTKTTLIYRRTKNLRAVQLLLGHSKLESTVRYLGIEVDDALEISKKPTSEPGPGRPVAGRYPPPDGRTAARRKRCSRSGRILPGQRQLPGMPVDWQSRPNTEARGGWL